MKYSVSTLLICVSIGSSAWAQQEHTPSSDQINQLLKRIEALEQTVHELREQIQSKDTPKGNPPEAATVTIAQPLQQLQSQENPITDPVVKISGNVFGDYYWMATHHDPNLKNRNGFWIRRAYLGLDKKLNQDFDMRLRLEMGSAGDFSSKSKLTPTVKDAYLRWKFSEQHQAYFGLSGTATWNLVERIWGYRPVEKSLLDLHKWGSSRDLGIALRGDLDADRKIRYHLMLGNGSGTGTETNAGKKVQLAFSFHPTDPVTIQFYTDYEDLPMQAYQRTLQGFIAFQYDWGRVGFQYAHQTRHGATDLELDALSIWGAWKLSPNSSLFARYDRTFDPNPNGAQISYLPFDPTARSSFWVAGLDFEINHSFNLMPNVEVIHYDKNEDGIRPTIDLVPRMTFLYNF